MIFVRFIGHLPLIVDFFRRLRHKNGARKVSAFLPLANNAMECAVDFANMKNESPHRKGAYSELMACLWLLSEGYEVFRNIVASGPADIVVFKNDKVIKIDVKTMNFFKGKPSFNRKAVCVSLDKNIEVLYVHPDGSCHWARDIDQDFGHNYQRKCP